MFRKVISPFQRLLALVALALVLPTVVLLVLELSFGLREHKAEIENQALDAASDVLALVDGRLQSDLSALRVLAIAQSAESGDWATFAVRARRVQSLNPGWRAILVTDTRSGRQIVDTSDAEPTVARPAQARYLAGAHGPPAITGVFREGRGCPCVAVNTPVAGDAGLIMTALIGADVFQDILAPLSKNLPAAAVVDPTGRFVARVPGFEQRVGTPGSAALQAAVRRAARDGLYKGRTLEGLRNYTAFDTSRLSGWSVHIAVPANAIDQPLAWTTGVRFGGAALALVLALGLVALALNELAMRRREEDSLRQTQKLEALGRLTGGVAHDFNNVLTVIIGALDMLSNRLDEPRDKRLSERALEAARRGARLTAQLLTFSRSQRLQVAATDVAVVVAGMDDLLRQSIGADIELSVSIEAAPLWAATDASQLEFAILNLALNARDAMPKGGPLTLKAGASDDGRWVVITLRDTGHGMEPNIAERAIEPFFTTKAADRGTGLGLAQVFGTVKQSGGSMDIDSIPGRGTTVRLRLPASAPAASVCDGSVSHALDGVAGGSILLVDDEAEVRAIMAEALASAGYRVDEAANGELALAALRTRPYDLLLTDFAMPQMNGAELARRARALRPAIKILMVSGYADSEAVIDAPLDAALLPKPLEIRALRDAVRSILG